MAYFNLTTATIQVLSYDSSRKGGSVTIDNLSAVNVYYAATADQATATNGGVIPPGGRRVQDQKPEKALFLCADATQSAPFNTRITIE